MKRWCHRDASTPIGRYRASECFVLCFRHTILGNQRSREHGFSRARQMNGSSRSTGGGKAATQRFVAAHRPCGPGDRIVSAVPLLFVAGLVLFCPARASAFRSSARCWPTRPRGSMSWWLSRGFSSWPVRKSECSRFGRVSAAGSEE